MTPQRSRRSVWLALAAIVALAAFVRFWGLGFGLPYTQARPDETFIIETARAFLRGNFYPPFYDYPWLSMWVTALCYLGYFVWGAAHGWFRSIADLLASWPVHWEPFFLIIRAVSATLGTATVIVVFSVASRIWDSTRGLVAALFMSLAFLHVRDSHFGTTDVAMTFLIVSSVAILIDAHETRRRSRFALAGFVAGLAAATKYNALLLGVPLLASQALHAIESRERNPRAIFDGRLLAFGIPFLLAFSIGIPFVVLDTQRFMAAMHELRSSMTIGTPNLDLEVGWIHHLELSLRYGLGLPLLIAGLAGMVGILLFETRMAILLLSFPIVYYIVAGSIRNLFFRYTIPVIPFLCLAAAWLVCGVAARVASRLAPGGRPSGRPFASAAVTAVAAALVIWPSASSIWQFDRIMSRTDNRVVVSRWFTQNVPEGSSVLQTGSRYGLVQFEPQVKYMNWVWDGGRGRFFIQGRPATGRPDWILVQDSPLPSSTQPIVKEFLQEGYVFVSDFPAVSLEPGLVYNDRQDAFFVPIAGLERVTRPGPNFSLYKRAESAGRHVS